MTLRSSKLLHRNRQHRHSQAEKYKANEAFHSALLNAALQPGAYLPTDQDTGNRPDYEMPRNRAAGGNNLCNKSYRRSSCRDNDHCHARRRRNGDGYAIACQGWYDYLTYTH